MIDAIGSLDFGRFPGLPPSFDSLFSRSLVDAGGILLHVVRGGEGLPLLLIPGWPQSWFAWRLVMPLMVAAGYHVIAVDPKGMGDSAAPDADDRGSGYSTGAIAAELAKLMTGLGFESFHVAGHDVGMWIAYALAADHPARVRRIAMIDAIIPGLDASPPLLGPGRANDRLWHFPLNRAPWAIQAPLFADGGDAAYVAWQFRIKAATPDAIPAEVVRFYQDATSGERMRACLHHYRAIEETIAQNGRRRHLSLAMPVLAVGGEKGVGAGVGNALAPVSLDLQRVVLPGVGHYVPEEAPEALAALLTAFFGGEASRTRSA